jgi:hypothetical protein
MEVRDWVIDVQGGTVDTAPPTVRTYPAAGAGVDTSIPLGFGRGVEEAPEAPEGLAVQPAVKFRRRGSRHAGSAFAFQVAVESPKLRRRNSGCGGNFYVAAENFRLRRKILSRGGNFQSAAEENELR